MIQAVENANGQSFGEPQSQRSVCCGFLGARFIQREIVRSLTSNPSIRSSPWMRGAPQVGFSATIRQLNSRTCFGVCLRPIDFRTREISFQYKRKPARCQRTTVSSVTTIRACRHPHQNLRAMIQKTLSNISSRGLRCFRFSTASCWRRARFSSRKLRRARKMQRIVLNRSLKASVMQHCYRNLLVERNAVYCSNYRRAGFWRGTGTMDVPPGDSAALLRPRTAIGKPPPS